MNFTCLHNNLKFVVFITIFLLYFIVTTKCIKNNRNIYKNYNLNSNNNKKLISNLQRNSTNESHTLDDKIPSLTGPLQNYDISKRTSRTQQNWNINNNANKLRIIDKNNEKIKKLFTKKIPNNKKKYNKNVNKKLKSELNEESISNPIMMDDNRNGDGIKQNHNEYEQKKRQQQQQQRKLGIRGQRQKLNKNALRLLTGSLDNIEDGGAFPPLFNIAPRAIITVNATCGQNGREEYCKLVDAYPHQKWATQCGICNSQSLVDLDKHHPIEKILDNIINLSDNWWQSPTLRNGREFEYITITLDLRQEYQIFFIMLKAAISPRPASWILEKSMDNITYEPWQYFGLSDNDCRRRYNTPGQTGKYIFTSDNEVICTTQYSKAMPLENGEIHVSLLKNRPGAIEQSIQLMKFISARYIRIRLQGMHTTANIDNSVDWLLDSQSLEKRSFYSLKQIRVSGRLNCHGHANRTFETILEKTENEIIQLECGCIHNTCGIDCSRCCPLHQEKPFRDGTLRNKNLCGRCQCNGHSQHCQYDSNLGRGICQNCHNNTNGNKCELCLPGYFRPSGAGAEVGCKKCDCTSVGSTDICNPDDGKCNCRQGFVGEKCELCAQGYYGESCLQCACDTRGTIASAECDKNCQCKQFVEGETCSNCSLGYFGLRTDNIEGCLKCYCSGVGLSCKSYHIQTVSYETLEQWKVTDLSKTIFAYPSFENSSKTLIFGMYDLPGVESFYWLAPKGYLGNKLTSYGAKFILQLSWVVIRGDTSGKPTTGPNIILFGRNGVKIAYGDDDFQSSSALINVELREYGWYHIPKSVKDIVTRMRRDEYHGEAVTRAHLMSVLSDLEAVLIRGRFHTDQVESVLERATMYSGNDDNEFDNKNEGFIEECICPPGYTGLSCENCDFGYIRVYENSTSNPPIISKCIQCPCNGHAEFCNLDTAKCGECQHNTYGERCERCKVGFYGNPMQGTSNDCKQCACPLPDNSNNFSPNCQLKKLSLDINQFGKFEEEDSEYICTQCPTAMVGDHCELCDDGYYGNPNILGSTCQPCNCDGGPCDILTGQCIECLGNTEGWRCERCKVGYWGDPQQGCEPCDCYDQGSTTDICDLKSGQCLCKLQFTGLKCNKCDYGYADIDLKCMPCQCNTNGSTDIICDPVNGQCMCKVGVTGLKCNHCDEEFFGLSDGECKECQCSSVGSASHVCDRRTGQCFCHTNVVGRRCEKCRVGNWNLTLGMGCQDCECHNIGSLNKECEPWSGQCNCKSGVGGRTCDSCEDGFFGFSNKGCIRCNTCQSSGYVCDPETGRCICPPNSQGLDCIQCLPGTWGWKPKVGCDKCHCDISGSIGQTCNIILGQCICREGYTGRRCDSCAIGYFGYPDCRRCNCNIDGSFIRGDGLIECDSNGQCPCKEHVIGLKCDTCVHSTFGLAKHNPEGCTKCFCFSRSQECQQSDLSWGHVRMPSSRNLSVQYVLPSKIPNKEYDYIIVVQMEGTEMYREDAEIGQINGLNLIPSSVGNVTIGAYTTFYYPLYFQLPPQFYGDKTNSYGGYLKFSMIAEGYTTQLDKKVLYDYPLVQLHAHNKLVLDYFEMEQNQLEFNETYNIPLHESFWRFHHNRQDVSRDIMMAALQNIKHIFLRATSWADFKHVVLHQVLMDAAIFLSGSTNIIAHGVEKCSCSSQYTGLSCQDPGQGYYRWKNSTEIIDSAFLEDVIGRSIPCECNGRSEECNQETGICLNCRDNTGGRNCESCAEGYYGDPNYSGCQSCPCPEANRNFARGCTVWNGEVNCICKPGYTGSLCDRCRNGYFGYPKRINGSCDSCNCNEDGIISHECDEETGQCNCRGGVTSRQCNICQAERHYLGNKRCNPCNNCTLILMDYIESNAHKLRRGIAHMDLTGIPAPWIKLHKYYIVIDLNSDRLDSILNTRLQLDNFDGTAVEKLVSYSENTKVRWRKLNATATKRNIGVVLLRENANQLRMYTIAIRDAIYKTIFELGSYGANVHHISLQIALEQARNYLKEITFHDNSITNMGSSWNCAWNNFYYYGNASDIVFDQKAQLEIFWIGFNNTNRRFADIGYWTDITFDILIGADDIQEHIINMKNDLQKSNKHFKELSRSILNNLNNNIVPETEVYLDMIDSNHDQIMANIKNIKNLQKFWNESVIEDNQLRHDLRKHWIKNAWRHANLLIERSNEYAKQFQPTKDGARVALFASSAHQNISDVIRAAQEVAIKAKERVFASQDKLYPMDSTSVISRAEKSLHKSKHLHEHAFQEIAKINQLKMELKIHEDKVDLIKSIIWHAGLKNNNISATLDVLNMDNAMKMSRNSRNLAINISDEMRFESLKAVDMKSDIYKLRLKFASLEPDWDTKLGMAEENISQTLSNIRTINNSLNNAEVHHYKAHQRFQLWNDTVSKQLQELKDKIVKARHAAEGIKVSLESLEPKCVRSYIPHSTGLSTSNTIKLTLAFNNRNGNSPLLFIQGHDRKFIALELYYRKIRLIWSLGGETTIITHPLELQTRDPKYDDAWYHVEANRTLNVGSVLVRRMTNNGDLTESNTVTGYSNLQYTRFYRTTTERLWLGGVPHELQIKELQSSPGLNVVVHNLYVDNKPLGLWNFVHSEGNCSGSMLGALESTASSNERHFNGHGYSVMKKVRPRPYRKIFFALQMEFKTLDENTLLFMAVDNKNNRTVSVSLNSGRIVFRIDYDISTKLEITSIGKHNTGKWIKIEAARAFSIKYGTENGTLKIGNFTSISGFPTTSVTIDMLPDLSQSSFILGGIPPGFREELIKNNSSNSFLGCMRDVAINGETYDALESSSYFGVEQSCKDIVAQAGFNGNAYIEMPSQSLRKRANFAFVFRTLQPDCLLLLSAYPPEAEKTIDPKEMRGNYSVSLIDGRIHVWIDSGRSSIQIISNQLVNDGEYHVINVIKTGRRVELLIDDELQGTKSLTGAPNLINMPKDYGGLYLGGAPDYFVYKSLSPTFIGFHGALRDIVFNNKSVVFNDALKFINVQIGHSGPQMGMAFTGVSNVFMKTEPVQKIFTVASTADGCQEVKGYSYEPYAYKYGDSQFSYSQMNVPIRNFWQKNFLIQFDLRTFYPNGILLISPGTKDKQKHYISLILKDGHLTLIVRGRRREELTLTAKLNNGEWHHITIHCQDRKVTMSVEIGGTDQKTSVQMKIPKKISASNLMFIGGLPENSVHLPSELMMKLEGFKGCVRQLEINNSTQDLAKEKVHLNVGQCFPKVEKGSYFSGNSYATFKKNFHVGKYLELEMVFRTSESNGVLLSVSEPVGFPALSLEVHQGSVILSCDLGDGNPFRVESVLPSKYAICDNQWHNISALYDFEEIVLRVDNHSPTIALAQHRVSGKVQTKSPLYIGGLPDIAPSGTLLSRKNFRGCIRNVSIRNERRDWIDMDYLHNVVLSECLQI